MTTSALAAELAALERRRLQCLVGARIEEARTLHTADFQLVTPSGGAWTKEQYLGGIGDGSIDYRRFEPVSEIEAMSADDLAVLRYQSMIDITVVSQEPGPLDCWHVDCYRRDPSDGAWRVRWSQATEIRRAP